MKMCLSLMLSFLSLMTFSACNQAGTPLVSGSSPTQVSAAQSEPEPSEVIDMKVADDFILIRSGAFTMGSPDSENWRSGDETQHTVTVSDFYMCKYEVTQKEYQTLIGNNPSTFSGENLPVENITWLEAVYYCNARSEREGLTPAYIIEDGNVDWDQSADGYRLPTEAEWEYACRAGTITTFNTENSISAEEANYYGHYPYEIENNYFSQDNLETKPGQYRQTTVAVGSFQPNNWGLYDMHGNVGEWCWDYYGEYETAAQDNPTGLAVGTLRVNRGGGWNDFAKNMRSAYRAVTPQDNSIYSVGFRLVRGILPGGDIITSTAKEQEGRTNGEPRILVAYFSHSGNTRGVAEMIREKTGADLFEIECATPYSSNYNTVLEQAQRDQNIQARPELKNHADDMSQYDVIILGYPNWWASIPMPIASFLEEYDFSGKTIMPFCSNGGGRFGQSLSAIAKLAPDATITAGLSVNYSGGSRLAADVSSWVSQNNINEQ